MNASRNRFGPLGGRLAELEARVADRMQGGNESKDALWKKLIEIAVSCENAGNINPSPNDSAVILAAKALARGEADECGAILGKFGRAANGEVRQ